jgi:lysophospholipase L1-like esterase
MMDDDPRSRVRSTPYKQTLNAINAQIRASTEDNRLIDLNANLKADDTMDGVHLTEAGARRWRSAIEAAVCPSWSSAHAVSVIQIPQ